MKAILFLFLVCPVLLCAQETQLPPANGSTDCPTFGKKNNFSKAGLFQYMRTHKPQRVPDPRQQQNVYRASALPDLQQAQEQRDMAIKTQNTKKQKKERRNPQTEQEPILAAPAEKPVAQATPVKHGIQHPSVKETEKDAKSEADDETTDEQDSNVSSSNELKSADASDAAREKREKKMKRAAFKAKMHHLFKKTNKPASRKNVQKCPTF